MKQMSYLAAFVTTVVLCAGCESFSKYREKQTKIARGEYKEPTGPEQHGTATQPLFKPQTLNQIDPEETGPVIRADIMLVNGQQARSADVLEPIWHRLERMAAKTKPEDYPEQMHRVVYDRIRETINEFLVWTEVKKKTTTEMEETLKKVVDKEVRDRINKEFEGSQAKFERYLSLRGLTLEDYKVQEGRRISVHTYLREEILPQIRVSRRQLVQYYTENKKRFESPSKVRLQMIELPISEFLPEGRRDEAAKLEAHDKAEAQARKIMEELKAGKDFAEVAKTYSKGLHAEEGGRWDWINEDTGMAGRWAQPAKAAFGLKGGEFSGLIETPDGFFIVRAEEKVEGKKQTFEQVQNDLDQQLRDLMFERASLQFLAKLWVKADIQGYEAFRNRCFTLAPPAGYKPPVPLATEPADTQPEQLPAGVQAE